jgi:hypothetical protein
VVSLEERVEILEARVAELTQLLAGWMDVSGWSAELLPLDLPGISELHLKMHRVLERPPEAMNLEELRYWARILLSITPGYLQVVARTLGVTHPWAPYLSVAAHILQKASVDCVAQGHLFYTGLDIARRNAQQAGYLWALQNKGVPPMAPELLNESVDARLVELHRYLFGATK